MVLHHYHFCELKKIVIENPASSATVWRFGEIYVGLGSQTIKFEFNCMPVQKF